LGVTGVLPHEEQSRGAVEVKIIVAAEFGDSSLRSRKIDLMFS